MKVAVLEPVDVAARDEALARAHAGLPLGGPELRAILELKKSRYHALAKSGSFDHLKVRPVIGPRCYSGTLIIKWLRGESTYEPLSFGRKRVTR